MARPRKLGFWIALAGCVLSVSLCLISIFLDGNLSIALLAVGAAIFLPASVSLVSQVAGTPSWEKAYAAEEKKRPILNAGLTLTLGCIYLSQYFTSARSAEHEPIFHSLVGGTAVLLIGLGGFRLAAAVAKQCRSYLNSSF